MSPVNMAVSDHYCGCAPCWKQTYQVVGVVSVVGHSFGILRQRGLSDVHGALWQLEEAVIVIVVTTNYH